MATERVRWMLRFIPGFLLLLLFLETRAGKLYSPADPLFLLNSDNIQHALRNSSSAWVLEFYSSWCGHCVNYAPTWRALANDVKEWYPAIKIGVLDCAEEQNYETCKEYEISSYPTFKFFKAFTKEFTPGKSYKATEHEIAVVRQMMIDFLQTSTPEHRPPACPHLEPIWSTEVLSLLNEKNHRYTAIVFENQSSYVGREVMLDLIQHENIVVRRALSADKALLEKFGISSDPSCYLIYPNGSHGLINIAHPLRSLFSSHLMALPGVKRSLSHPTMLVKQEKEEKKEVHDWNQYDQSKLYMADLESGLHYLLRVELAAHKTLDGEKLKTFKDFITVLSKLFSGRQPVMKLLETLNDWLINLPLDKIPYDAILDLVNNKMHISGIFLPKHVKWVGCQGSRPELRGYTCSLWQLFHSLTVQASSPTDMVANADVSAKAALQVMRRYIQQFFGCRECAQHFEEMAKESMDSVKTSDDAVLWLWKKHNVVNNRLAGAPNEDPKFPKLHWPTRELCPLCYGDKESDRFNEEEVLNFLKNFYSTDNMSGQFMAEETNESQAEPAVEEGKKEDSVPKKPSRLDEKAIQDSKHASIMKPELMDKVIQNNHPVLKDLVKSGKELVAAKEDKQSIFFLGIGFSSIDLSLCVILYIASALFLMIMYFFFRMRSRRWKVRYNRPYV